MGFGGFPGGGMGMLVGAEVIKTFFEAQEKRKQMEQQLKVQQELGADTAKIEELQRMLKEQNAKVEALAAQKNALPAEAPAAEAPSEGNLKLQLEVLQQQKELELLKQQKVAEAVN